MSNRHGAFAYAAPFPASPPMWYGPSIPYPYRPVEPDEPWVPSPAVTLWPCGLSDEDRAMLKRIEEKLDRVEKKMDALRTDGILAIMPGDEKRADETVAKRVAEQVEEIRRRVREALGEKT